MKLVNSINIYFPLSLPSVLSQTQCSWLASVWSWLNVIFKNGHISRRSFQPTRISYVFAGNGHSSSWLSLIFREAIWMLQRVYRRMDRAEKWQRDEYRMAWDCKANDGVKTDWRKRGDRQTDKGKDGMERDRIQIEIGRVAEQRQI